MHVRVCCTQVGSVPRARPASDDGPGTRPPAQRGRRARSARARTRDPDAARGAAAARDRARALRAPCTACTRPGSSPHPSGGKVYLMERLKQIHKAVVPPRKHKSQRGSWPNTASAHTFEGGLLVCNRVRTDASHPQFSLRVALWLC